MKARLSDIAQLQFGFYTKPTDNGNAAYLLAKHFDDWGNQTIQVDAFIQIDQKNENHLLQDGDVLLVGKGMRNFAWTYNKSYGPAIASSIFFVIKPDTSKVLPDFLTTLFNMPQTQSHFQTLGAGSSIPSIRKSELEALPIILPSLELQQKVIAIKRLHEQDMDLSRKIIAEKQKVYHSVAKKIMNHEGWVMRENIIKEKSFKFAVRIVNLYKLLTAERKEFIMSKQLMRSGTSIGANIREAQNGESKADFIHKLGIAQKEADETLYWLELLTETKYLQQHEFESMHHDGVELLKILRTIILNAKQKNS